MRAGLHSLQALVELIQTWPVYSKSKGPVSCLSVQETALEGHWICSSFMDPHLTYSLQGLPETSGYIFYRNKTNKKLMCALYSLRSEEGIQFPRMELQVVVL